jgi:hypothetical protein
MSVYVRQQMRVRMATDRSERENAAVAKPAAEEFPALTEPQYQFSPRLSSTATCWSPGSLAPARRP